MPTRRRFRALLPRLVLGGLLPWGGLLYPAPAAADPYVRDANRFIEKSAVSWKEIRNRNVVLQKYDFSCGGAALATLMKYHWGDEAVTEEAILDSILKTMTLDDVRDRIRNGLSMTDLRRGAVVREYFATVGERDFFDLYQLKVPVIVRLEKNDYEHFVVLKGLVGDRVYIADPIRGNLRMSADEFVKEWNKGSCSKGAVLVVAKPGVKPPERSALMVDRPCWKFERPELLVPWNSLLIRQGHP